MELVEFLLERIGEDEAIARAATAGPWTNDGGIYAGHPTNEIVDYVYEDNAEHIARHDPARVLAECEAHRRIVELYDPAPADQGWLAATEQTLRLLALPYRNHSDYRSEWTL